MQHNKSSKNDVICSICIANYNGMDTLGLCLSSIMNQNCSIQIEIIIHDDASQDQSVEWIKANYPFVKMIESKENVGFCVSNNRMVDMATGEYILLLNNDAELFPDAIQTLYDHAKKIQTRAILGLPQYNLLTGQLLDYGYHLDPFLNTIPNLSPYHTNVASIIGACLWIPKSVWQELGGFPEFFFMLVEDVYLCCYARLKEYPVKIIPQSGFKHLIGKSIGGGKLVDEQMVTSMKRRRLSERNKVYAMIILIPGLLCYLTLFVHFICLVSEGIIVSCYRKNWQIWRSIYWSCIQSTWKNRKKLFQKRRIVQKNISSSCGHFIKPHSLVPYKLKMLLLYRMPIIK